MAGRLKIAFDGGGGFEFDAIVKQLSSRMEGIVSFLMCSIVRAGIFIDE
jgi:hypothetical protein